jgi:hypothetical protein
VVVNPLGSINSAFDTVNRIQGIAVQTATIELQEAAIELRGQLLSAKETILEQRERIAELEAQVNAADAQELDPEQSYWYTKEGKGPYCPQCYLSRGKTILLSTASGNDALFGTHVCQACPSKERPKNPPKPKAH